MRNHCFQLLSFFLLFFCCSFGQKLKKADRAIVSNIQNHINFLTDSKLDGRKSGSAGENLADNYIKTQLERDGIKPKAENNSWFQKFNIYDGQQIMPSTYFNINGKTLQLHKEFFPFPFSASKKAEASVAIALSENGVPWFADLKDMLDHPDDTSFINPTQLIRLKAGQAASKGATALIIFNKSDSGQLQYKSKDDGPETSIPVLYVTKTGVSKYLSDESANLELKLNIELARKERGAQNIIAFQDQGADSTIMITAHLDDETDVASLLEIARLLKKTRLKANNFLYVIYTGEEKGSNGYAYFNEHPTVDLKRICTKISIDSLGNSDKAQKGLYKVREAMAIIEATNELHKVSPNKKA